MPISKSALKKGEASIIEGYRKSSIIREVVDCRPFEEKADSSENYVQIGLRTLVPKDWFKASSNVILELGSIGRSVAMGEENFLIEEIQEKCPESNVRKMDTFTVESVMEAFAKIRARGCAPSVLFIPIEFFAEMHRWRTAQDEMAIQYPSGPRAFFSLDESTKLRIFWSSRHVPLDKILIFDKSFGEWIVKTVVKTGDYIQAKIVESKEPDKMEIAAKTVVKFAMRRPETLQILVPKHTPKREKKKAKVLTKGAHAHADEIAGK